MTDRQSKLIENKMKNENGKILIHHSLFGTDRQSKLIENKMKNENGKILTPPRAKAYIHFCANLW